MGSQHALPPHGTADNTLPTGRSGLGLCHLCTVMLTPALTSWDCKDKASASVKHKHACSGAGNQTGRVLSTALQAYRPDLNLSDVMRLRCAHICVHAHIIVLCPTAEVCATTPLFPPYLLTGAHQVAPGSVKLEPASALVGPADLEVTPPQLLTAENAAVLPNTLPETGLRQETGQPPDANAHAQVSMHASMRLPAACLHI